MEDTNDGDDVMDAQPTGVRSGELQQMFVEKGLAPSEEQTA